MKPPASNGQSLLAEGVALMHQGQFAEAEAAFLDLLKREPRNANAWYFIGLTLAQAGRLEEGVGHLRRAITLELGNALFQLNLGVALLQLGRNEEALVSLNAAVALDPNLTHAHYNRGVIFLKLNRPDQAIEAFADTIKLQPDFADAHADLGYALTQKHRHPEALAAYQKALNLRPNSAAYLLNVAMALCALLRHGEALPLLDKLRSIKPDDEATLLVRAQALLGLNRASEAIEVIESLLAANPHHVTAIIWRSSALIRLNRPQDALMVTEQARSIAPEVILTHLAHAQALVQLNRLEEALVSYDHALKLDPEDTDAVWGRGLTLLTLGRFEEGWVTYEARKRKPGVYDKPEYSQPFWRGQEALTKKRLFAYWEQGYGDTIQFARYVLLAAAAGAEVVLSVQDPLRRLFKDFGPNITVIGQYETPEAFDLHSPLLSMPLGFGTRLETIPSMAGGYLKAAAGDVATWQQKLPAGRVRLGLVWSGSVIHRNDNNRSLPLARLQGLLNPDHAWISLQRDIRDSDRSAFEACGLLDPSGELRDFADTAALISALDLVITVDTSVAHLAGALGKPCWVMLPFAPDFRWLLDRDDTPWYSTLRLFRQQSPGDWDGVLQRIAQALSSRFS